MKITIKKIKKIDLEILQSELLKFIRNKVDNIPHCRHYEKYCNDIIVVDTLQSMFYIFRAKIESNKVDSTISLTPTQLIILLYCCQWDRKERTQEQGIVMQTMSDKIHEKIVNI